MRFWLPVLLVEVVILWLLARSRSDQSADEQQANAFAAIIVGAIFLFGDVITFTIRNW